ncbi:MAG TPA: STAS domain-containing protein [Solirubrobacteraceae bacterium]
MGSAEPPERNVPQLRIELSERDGTQIVALFRELDLRAADELQAVLDRACAGENARVCLDLSGLQFIDSTGLAIVIRSHQATVAAGGAFAVVCAAGTVRRTLEMTGLMTMLNVAETVDEALQALEG